MMLPAQSWRAHKAVGVDIDDSLVQGAWRRRRTVWSLQEAGEKATTNSNSGKRKREPIEVSLRPDYFPISCEHEFGSLPIPPSQNRGKHIFPHNMSFRTADWVSTTIPEDADRYNVVMAYIWRSLSYGND